MTLNNRFNSEIQDLCERGELLLDDLKQSADNSEMPKYFIDNYEQWYSLTREVIRQLLPNRLIDFTILYRDDKRKSITVDTYSLSDAARNHTFFASNSLPNSFDIFSKEIKITPWWAFMKLVQQLNILKACRSRLESLLFDITTTIQAELIDSEIETAKHLLKCGHLRAAGAISGVVIEAHFSKVAERHGLKLKKASPTISDYNDLFKDEIYDVVRWREIQRLGDIRNYCVHNKDREPTKDELLDLINGAEKTVKTIF